MYIFLDESGNLDKDKDQYFIVASYTVGDPRRIAKAFRKWQKTKLPKKVWAQAEVKFHADLEDDVKIRTIKYLAKQDLRIFYTYLNKKNIPEEYRKNGKVAKTGLLYAEIVVATLELYLPLTETEFLISRDPRTLKGLSTAKFNEVVKTSLIPKLPAKTLFNIQTIDSTASANIQVADWICGALARYHEKKAKGEDFYNILKKNIVQEKELFSDYWTKKWQDKD